MPLGIPFDQNRFIDLCRRYHVARLELLGSRAKGTARMDSDVDLLVTFEPNSEIGLEYFGLGIELETLFGRRVDLLTRPRVERDQNARFRSNILDSVELLYAA
jgi:predicted nucleotidyltransferase